MAVIRLWSGSRVSLDMVKGEVAGRADGGSWRAAGELLA
jgi:hypothetical protein